MISMIFNDLIYCDTNFPKLNQTPGYSLDAYEVKRLNKV